MATTNPGLQVIFNPPVIISSVGGVSIKTSEIFIVKTVDSPVHKTVLAYSNRGKIYTLWAGSEYDSIGQWTDTDVINRIKELVSSGI